MKRSYLCFLIFSIVRTLFYSFLYFNMYSSVSFISSFCQSATEIAVLIFNFTLFVGVPVVFTILFAVYYGKSDKSSDKKIKRKEQIVFWTSIVLVWLSAFIQYQAISLGF